MPAKPSSTVSPSQDTGLSNSNSASADADSSVFAPETFWRRFKDRSPMTWQGLFLLALSGGLLWTYGIGMRDWILLVIGGFGVAMVLLSQIGVVLGATYLRWRLNKLNAEPVLTPILTDTSQTVISGFLLPRFVPPFLDFFGMWKYPEAEIAPISLFPQRTEEVHFAKRGRYQHIVRVFEVRDLFGLALVRWRIVQQRDIEIWPRSHRHLPPFAMAFSDGDDRFVPTRPRRGDRVDTRPYLPGDSIRLIHWKMFARSNQPFVRIPEPAASYEKQIISYLVSDDDDEFAAQIARYDLEHGSLGNSWQFGADRGDEVATAIHVARRQLALSGTRPARYGQDLETFLQSVAFKVDQHRLILYVSGELHRWLPTLEPILQRYGAVTTLIVANESAPSLEAWKASLEQEQEAMKQSTKRHSWWSSLLLRPAPKGEADADIPQPWGVLRALSQRGMQLQLMHPPQGTPPSHAASSSKQMRNLQSGRPSGIKPPGTPPPGIGRPSTPPPPRRVR